MPARTSTGATTVTGLRAGIGNSLAFDPIMLEVFSINHLRLIV
jgi:hypothetical protein